MVLPCFSIIILPLRGSPFFPEFFKKLKCYDFLAFFGKIFTGNFYNLQSVIGKLQTENCFRACLVFAMLA
ncbi:hypothetical protein KsCSTR_49570 [Candidatus Kuenenia stuttgartiensis]|uniref:Uncharacterized protein n=1 Tax=Kuenenia stuttgartiensis TaxID=174633 RepID=A0A6G7GY99_KUEST|nr:hypothetical protein KsCSTR_49570 [Candidatus Kuenenia stuttgartiensis]